MALSRAATALSTATKSEPGPRGSLRSGLIVSAITVVLLLVAIEGFGYIWEQRTAAGPLGWTLVGARRIQLDRRGTNDAAFYRLRPNMDYQWSGIPVHINSQGFRTEEVVIPKPADTIRILNLGDSVAFGWQVEQSQTYGKLLEQMLNARNDGHHYEVINAGTPGWGTGDERNFLLQEGLKYQPDIVLLDITLVNDIYGGVAEAGQAEAPTLTNWLREHSYIWPMLTTEGRMMLSKSKGPEAIPVLNPPRDAAAYFPVSQNDPYWNKWWTQVTDMQGALQPRGIRFVVVPFPTAFQFASHEAHPDTPERVISARAPAAGIDVVDPLPQYKAACAAAGPDACDGYINMLSGDVWMHPSPLGHQLAAQALGKVLP